MEMPTIDIVTDPHYGLPVEYGLTKIAQALTAAGFSPRSLHSADDAGINPMIVASVSSREGAAHNLANTLGAVPASIPESLAIRTGQPDGTPAVAVAGYDEIGLMYGLLDVATQIGQAKDTANPLREIMATTESPYVAERSMSIYTMHGGVWEKRLHDTDHWVRTFELMAESRLNSFAVIFGYENGGFMAPAYPYFFDVPGFSDIRVTGLDSAQQARNAEAFRTIIDTAHRYGIRFVAGLWDHIYRGGVQDGGLPNAPRAGEERAGIVTGVTGENVAAYNRAALEKFPMIFPEVDGLQLRMHNESGLAPEEMEGFWHGVFLMVKERRPDLRLDLRAKELPDSIIDDALHMNLSVRVTTKFWMEQHGMPYHPTHINVQNQHDRRHSYADLLRKPLRYDVHWRLWNAVTSGGLLWADPDWVRRFVATAHPHGSSFEFNEPNATWMLGQPHESEPLPIHTAEYRWYKYEVERHWHTLQLFGRVGYNPAVSEKIWVHGFRRRFGDRGAAAMAALHAASTVAPRIVAAAYCYPMFPTTVGSICRDSQGPLPEFALAEGSDIQQFASFREEAELILHRGTTARRRPLDTALWFENSARTILAFVEQAGYSAGDSAAVAPELATILTDARILAHLAGFYSIRIPAAVSYNLFLLTGDLYALDDALAGERDAVAEWRLMEIAAGEVYEDILPVGVRRPAMYEHWREERRRLEGWLADLEGFRDSFESLAPDSRMPLLAHVPVTRLDHGEDLIVRATAKLPGAPKRVNISILSQNGETRAWQLNHEKGSRYRCTIPAHELPHSFAYVIDAQTGNGHRIATPGGLENPISVMVGANTEPPHIEHTPETNTKQGIPVGLRLRATSPSGITWVRLRYRHMCHYEEYRAIDMERSGGFFEAAIPADYVVPEWDLVYFFEALDESGNGAIYPDFDIRTPYFIVAVESTTPTLLPQRQQ